MKKIFILFMCLSAFSTIYSQSVNIIPLPNKIEMGKGVFILTDKVAIIPSRTNLDIYLSGQIKTLTGIKLVVLKKNQKSDGSILLKLDKSLSMDDEAYQLQVSSKSCEIIAKTETGLFYGIQSFLQLLPEKNISKINIPCLKITDSPRFEWRGMHLDVSRHFFPKAFILKYLDLIAMYKMNVFHFHLVDDQGWRIEIKKYPKLTELGAWREDDTDKPWNYFIYPTNDKSKKLYGGFYTQNDIREIVKYATDRKITVVPEIEMPGHCGAMLEAYPEFSCTGKPWRKNPKLGWEFSDPVCVGNEQTYEFLENILSEVMDLFPSKYIHVGGDECKKTTWESCPKCQARMKAEGFTHPEQLQSYLIQRIEKFLLSKNRKLIGWDEILEGGLAPEATVMSWNGIAGGVKAAKMGHRVVMTPDTHCYFDFPQFNEMDKGGNNISLEKVYHFEPISSDLSPAETKFVLGAQGNVWTERMITSQKVEEMVLPRMLALSEVLWTDTLNRNYEDFLKRINSHYLRLKTQNYAFNIPPPTGMLSSNLFINQTLVTLINKESKGDIYYTTDNSEPNLNSPKYTSAVEIKSEMTLKAKVILPNGIESAVVTGKYIPAQFIEPEKVDISKLKSGVKYNYYEGVISKMADFPTLSLKSSGIADKFEFPKTYDPLYFGLLLEGYIYIQQDGIYSFYTSSDDGSMLYVANELVVNNDESHGNQERSGQIALKAGYHKIKAMYFQSGGGMSFKVMMKTEKGGKIEIATSILMYL